MAYDASGAWFPQYGQGGAPVPAKVWEDPFGTASAANEFNYTSPTGWKTQQAQQMGAAQIQALQQASARKQSAFNLLTQQLHRGGGLGAIGGQAPTGGFGGINANPIWDPSQIQQQVDTARANNDISTTSRIRDMMNQKTARGFAPNSPLLDALTAQYQGQNLATNTANETQFRATAASDNAAHQLSAQQAASSAWLQYQQNLIARQNALLGALSAYST